MAGTYEELLTALKQSDKTYDIEKIQRAYECAARFHDGQFRQSGEPYISHPVSVALILVGLGMDTDCLCAALLHDVVEDTDATLERNPQAVRPRRGPDGRRRDQAGTRFP